MDTFQLYIMWYGGTITVVAIIVLLSKRCCFYRHPDPIEREDSPRTIEEDSPPQYDLFVVSDHVTLENNGSDFDYYLDYLRYITQTNEIDCLPPSYEEAIRMSERQISDT